MKTPAFILVFFLVITMPVFAQSTADIENIELSYKTCLQQGTDTSLCGRTFLRQMDSVVDMVYEKVRVQLSAEDKIKYINEHKAWMGKKSEFFKKQDENFSFNLKEGNWKSNMIWVVYQNKADFIKKRALALSKRLME